LAELGIDLDLRLAFQGRNPAQKGNLLRWFTISRAIVESMPSCVFLVRDTLGLDLRPWWNLFNAATGLDLDYTEFVMAGERLMNLDRAFNIREGYRRADDRPPIRMATEDVPGFGYPRLGPEIFEPMLDEYYEANGWSLSTSVPTRRKLAELGLADVAAEFEALGIEVEA
jgi:aldehyde:ferredoxin oxidoreductase